MGSVILCRDLTVGALLSAAFFLEALCLVGASDAEVFFLGVRVFLVDVSFSFTMNLTFAVAEQAEKTYMTA